MKKIELIPGIKSSIIGLGCAPILGAVDAKTSKIIIELCLENGINHFDLARSYGFGKAEGLIGKTLKGKREKVVLASKFGIRASLLAAQLAFLKPIVRRLRKNATGENSNVSSKKSDSFNLGRLLKRVRYSKMEMRSSLETSLRELRTDYLDYYFLHEPIERVENIDDIFEVAAKLKSEGKIRAFGLSYSRHYSDIHSLYLHEFDILQFNIHPFASDYPELVKIRKFSSNIFFSLLRERSNEATPEKLLQRVFSDFTNSIVLISMFTETHVKENIAVVENLARSSN